jgi:hypothetical protein
MRCRLVAAFSRQRPSEIAQTAPSSNVSDPKRPPNGGLVCLFCAAPVPDGASGTHAAQCPEGPYRKPLLEPGREA